MTSNLAFLAVLLVSQRTSAEAWHEGRAGRERKLHLAITIGAGVLYAATETVIEDAISPARCRWCEPTSFEASLRDSLRWNDVGRARTASDLVGHVAIPVLALGVTNASLLGTDAGWGELLDVTIPILETVFVTQVVTSFAKGAFGRERPHVHFSTTQVASAPENNLSFWSGHTSFAFAFATSAGTVARLRGMRSEPFVWGVGMTLAATTGYLRLAGDKHYVSDVLAGAVVGIGAGLTIPRLMQHDVTVTTTGTSVVVVGTF